MDSPRSEASSRSSCGSTKSSPSFDSMECKVRDIYNDAYWCCGGHNPDICQIVTEDDRQAALWFDRDPLDFEIDSYLNRIALCQTCHEQFDYALDPGFTFISTDLEYFINFEVADQQRRKTLIEAGNDSAARQVPSAEGYKNHQVAQGKITPDDFGGLYKPICLKPFLASDLCALFNIDIHRVLSARVKPLARGSYGIPPKGVPRARNRPISDAWEGDPKRTTASA